MLPSTAKVALGGMIVLLVVLEVLWAWRAKCHAYEPREVLCNLAIAVGNGLLRPIALLWSLLLLEWVESFQPFALPHSGAVFLATFVITDLAMYAYHRASHEWAPLWAIHEVHHSSPWLNITTAIRLSWLGKLISPLYFAPLALLGLPAHFIVLSLALGLLYQLPLHTQAIGSLGVLEGKLLNTPSAHRVHHGCNERYQNKNYAGVFILWDVLFGTYEAEDEPVRYGVTSGFVGHNPLRVQLQPLLNYLRGPKAVDDDAEKTQRVAHI